MATLGRYGGSLRQEGAINIGINYLWPGGYLDLPRGTITVGETTKGL